MKEFFKSYTSFTRTERMGLVALLAILLVLIAVRATMHLWVKPETNALQQQKLVAAWNAYKSEEQTNISKNYYKSDSTKTSERSAAIAAKPDAYKEDNKAVHKFQADEVKSTLFPFDPNTLDSAGFRRLGLREKTTAILLHWRNKGKIFRRKEELKKVYTLTPEEYERLEPYIRIKD
ncbi:MAG: helix-hairpin-helix domain-containing protein [Bacteroidetes bacterium]|nr:helix-hairpin-helix domain-containing protein [Bacteroidota bacterium]